MEKDKKQIINFESIIDAALNLPYCKIDRDSFLSSQLKGHVNEQQINIAIEQGTINAGINISLLNKLAKDSITFESTKVTLISTATGIPGGLAILGTMPADLAQYYAHVFRIAQKLAYIYGYKDLDVGDNIANMLIIFLGVMSGVELAAKTLAKFAAANAAKIGAMIAAKPLTKYTIYNITKKVLTFLGVKFTKDIAGKSVAKAIPVVSAILSGGFTVATFVPMSNKLKKYLFEYATMTAEQLEKAVIDADIAISECEE